MKSKEIWTIVMIALIVSVLSSVITIMMMKDVSFSSLEDWFSKDKDAPKGITLVGAVTLGGISAKQYVYGSRLITAAVDKKILFTIDSLRDPNLWDKVHDRIISSFAFVNPEASPASGSSGAGDNAIYEAEEVVE